MPYREPPARRSSISRRIVAPDSFRWVKLVVGLLMFVSCAAGLWEWHSNAVVCTDRSCFVRQDFLLRPRLDTPFDPSQPPEIVVERATYNKDQNGKRLLLRYGGDGDVELYRDHGEGVDARAQQLRTYFVQPVGSLSIQQQDPLFLAAVIGFLAIVGCLMFLDGLRLAGYQRVHADSARHVVVIDRVIFFMRTSRVEFPVTRATKVGRMEIEASKLLRFWLTFEDPGEPPRQLPIIERPETKAIVEDVLESA